MLKLWLIETIDFEGVVYQHIYNAAHLVMPSTEDVLVAWVKGAKFEGTFIPNQDRVLGLWPVQDSGLVNRAILGTHYPSTWNFEDLGNRSITCVHCGDSKGLVFKGTANTTCLNCGTYENSDNIDL